MVVITLGGTVKYRYVLGILCMMHLISYSLQIQLQQYINHIVSISNFDSLGDKSINKLL